MASKKKGRAGRRRRARAPAREAAAARRRVARAWLVFVGVFGGLLGLFAWADPVLAPRINAWTARLVAVALRLTGVEAHAVGASLPNSVFPIEIIWECTGVTPMALFAAAVLAYPAPWRRKLAGLAAGLPALLAINIVRMVSLVWIGHWKPEAFETAHVLVWQTLMVFATVLLWLVWVAALAGPSGAGVRARPA